MKNNKHFFALLVAFCALFAACDLEFEPGTGTSQNITLDLRGTWESSDKSVFSGKLVMDYNTITITGYYEGQTNYLPDKDDNKRPFKDFSKGIPLKAYTEIISTNGNTKEGRIFFEVLGAEHEGIPYTYTYTTTYTPVYKKTEILTFDFGGRKEELRKTEED